MTSGLLLVDKPVGPTSHDVVARARRALGTRRVGHAGTLDPMASGLLILGVDRATKLLGHLSVKDKSYQATVRLGESTTTDDAQGERTAVTDASGLPDERIAAALAAFTGDLLQVPSTVSAIKVDGQRAYARVRAGETVELAARPVTVRSFDLVELRRGVATIDLDVRVDCSTGTYVRALARDLGVALGVGAHLTALRRTRIGPFAVDDAVDLDALEIGSVERARSWVLPAAAAVREVFPVRLVDDDCARELSYGRSLEAAGIAGTYAVLDGAGKELLALVAESGGRARPVLVWRAAG